MSEWPGFCDRKQEPDEPAALTCDLPRGHGGSRHAEQFVATWKRDGSDVRWNVAHVFDRPRYVSDAAKEQHPRPSQTSSSPGTPRSRRLPRGST